MYKNMPWSKEKRREYMKKYRKKYYEDNKDKIKEQIKEYYEDNIDKVKEYRQTDKGKKVNLISHWKNKGLIHDDYDDLYEKYLNSTNCQECGCAYGKKGDGTSTFKCMDHDHTTGLFRNFLCCKCNLKRR